MKLKCEFVINDVAGTSIAVPIGEESDSVNGYIRLNETGTTIFRCLSENTTKEQIVDALLSEYEGATKEEIIETVDEFLAKLRESDLLEDD